MATILLCHGAWSGGWIWRRVVDILRSQGHTVFAPTYTGLGERRHLMSPEIDLETHIQDVRGVIECEDLDRFILVGHSYGGMVVSGVADREWQKITRLVYLDAFLPEDGQSLADLAGPERAKATQEIADKVGDGYKVPRPEGSISPLVSDDDREWISSHSGFHPLATQTQRIKLAGNHLKIADKVYILGTLNTGSPFFRFAEWTRAQPDWTTVEQESHHHMMVSHPDETARLLVG